MKEILKTLKKYSLQIIMVFVLLIIQAMCDLELPTYTSRIVDVGITQNGIASPVFEVASEKWFDKIIMFADEKDVDTILNNYELITKESSNYNDYLKKYPILENLNIYVIKDISKEEKEKLEGILEKPILIVTSIQNNPDQIREKMNLPESMKDVDLFTIFSTMDENALSLVTGEFDKQFDNLEPMYLKQGSIMGVKAEYLNVGVDLEKLQMNYIWGAGVKMILLALIVMVITVFTTYISSKIAAFFSRDLRSKVVNKVMSFSNKEFEDFSTASLITRSTNDIQQIQMLIVMLLRIVFYAPIMGIGAFTKVTNSSMAWVIGVAVLIIMSVVAILFTVALPKFQIIQKTIDKLNLVAREILSGIPVIRAFATDKHEEKRFDDANKDLTKVNLFVNKIMTVMMPTMMFIMNGVSILIIWVGAHKINAGSIQIGSLIAFITYTMQIIMAFLMISMVSIMIPRAFVSVKRIGEIFKKDSSIKDKDDAKILKNIKGVIEFKDVYFRYPDAEEDVLQNVSFKAVPGTTTAFIGSTGSGKSTLINLIPRFFDVTGGKITIDGINIKDVKLSSLRSNIGYVPQKGNLFSGTIKSNIEFGLNKISDEQLKKAASISQALDFIEEKEEKFDSTISQGGTNVSGGQRQRLSIARAIAIDPKIYIFDDSFSALDYKTDIKLRKALSKETKGSTIFIVAQRISTVLNADQIVVLDKGEVVGIGTHQELMKKCSVYEEIALSQLSKEELAHE